MAGNVTAASYQSSMRTIDKANLNHKTCDCTKIWATAIFLPSVAEKKQASHIKVSKQLNSQQEIIKAGRVLGLGTS